MSEEAGNFEISALPDDSGAVIEAINKRGLALPGHDKMLATIKENLPELKRATKQFGKRQSQFMDNFLTVNHPTPIRNARQCLAEIERAMAGLREAHFKTLKRQVDLEKLQRRLCRVEKWANKEAPETEDQDPRTVVDWDLEVEDLKIQIAEIEAGMAAGDPYISGAVRKIANLTEQYNAILTKHGKTHFTEEDFEMEESRYHVAKAFSQAITAFRARGNIDEGNYIYFQQIGISGLMARTFIAAFMNMEQALLKSMNTVPPWFEIGFIEDMVSRFHGSTSYIAEHRGYLKPINKDAMVPQEVESGVKLVDPEKEPLSDAHRAYLDCAKRFQVKNVPNGS